MPNTISIQKPRKLAVPLAAGLAWRGGGGFIYARKYDGQFAALEFAVGNHSGVMLGEHVRPKSGGCFTVSDRALLVAHGEFFAAFRLASLDGENMLGAQNGDAWRELAGLFSGPVSRREKTPGFKTSKISGPIILAETGCGGEWLQHVIAAGGEGIAAQDSRAPWGEILACKRLVELLCVITGFCPGLASVEIADASTGQPRGRMPLPGGKIDRCRVGSILKCAGMGLTDRGLLREPRLCADTPESWLKQF